MRTIPYGHQWIDDTDIKSVLRVLRSGWITQGPKVEEFENALCRYAGAKYAVAVSSGTAALHVSCLAANINPRDEVIVSPITFAASANCVLYCGGQPVFADVQQDTFNISPDKIKDKVTSRTRAVIPVHFAGHPCDMREISNIARKNNLVVIEDAAHALSAEYRGSRIGSCRYSDMTIFSFHPVKHITTGEGGAVLTNDKALYDKLLMIRNHGITKDARMFDRRDLHDEGQWYYEIQDLGFNYRITDIQCALGINQLKKARSFFKIRRYLASCYDKILSGIDGVITAVERPYVRSSRHIYYVRIKDEKKRKAIFEGMRKEGIGVQVHYLPVYLHPYYRRRLGYKEGLCPAAEKYYRQTITLPLYPKMTLKELNTVVRKFAKILKSKSEK